MTKTEAMQAYDRLGITAEMERVVIDYLKSIGASDTCYGTDGNCDPRKCTDPNRPKCTKTLRNNCICTRT